MSSSIPPAARSPFTWVALIAALGGGAGLKTLLGPSSEVVAALAKLDAKADALQATVARLELAHAQHLAEHGGIEKGRSLAARANERAKRTETESHIERDDLKGAIRAAARDPALD